MMLADIELARRLEPAEGYACLTYAQAHLRVSPNCGAAWLEHAGAQAVFDGVDSPLTQCFGFGVKTCAKGVDLDRFEHFFATLGAPTSIELSPLAGVEALDLLVSRGYRPIEISSVLYRDIAVPEGDLPPGVWGRRAEPSEKELWSRLSAEGWAEELPDMKEFLEEMGSIMAAREDPLFFLAGIGDEPGAAGAQFIHEGVALFAGSATIPRMRRRGLQAALLRARMQFAAERGCDLAMMVAMAGSGSQRNAERQGFRIAYTRTKWQLKLKT